MANIISLTMDDQSKLAIAGQPFVVEGENITTTLTLAVPTAYSAWEKQVHFGLDTSIRVTDGTNEMDSNTYAIVYTGPYDLPQQLIDARILKVQVVLISGDAVRPSEVRSFPYYRPSIEADPRNTALPSNVPPSAPTDAGVAGSIRYDANYLYVCIATNTWKRCALSSW